MGVKIDLKIFIFFALFLITGQSKIYAILMAFAFIHEIGHLIAGILLGLKPKKMKIMPFGISISFKYCKKTNIQRLLIAAAGPVTNLLIAGILFFVSDFNERSLIIYSNILIALFNLIPIYPLDGGRIIKGILGFFYDYHIVDKNINIISNISIVFLTVVSSIMILELKNIAILIILIYLWAIVIYENRNYKIKRRINMILQKDREKRKRLKAININT
jgi:stage IV sporulation protein FB